MTSSAVDQASAEEWGPVRRGFGVWLADGRRGSVADILLARGGGVELLVATGRFLRTLVTVRAAEIKAILPGERRIIVGQAGGGPNEARGDADVESLPETVRLPVERASSAHSPLDAA